MVAANLSSKNKSLDHDNLTYYNKNIKILNSAVIYGANASGKSNLIKSIAFMRNFILNSSKDTQVSESIKVESYSLSTATDKRPSYFEIVFAYDSTTYRYGFEADKEKVHSEWLYISKTREVNLFERNNDKIEAKGSFKEGKGLETKTRENALFLSVCAQFNGDISKLIVRYIQEISIISGIQDMHYRPYTIKQLENSDESRISVLKMLQKFDFDISDIATEHLPVNEKSFPKDMPEGLIKFFLASSSTAIQIKTIHKKYDESNKHIGSVAFNLDNNESEGTQKMFSMCGPLLDVLSKGMTLIIDELDARLHPIITRQIIKLFNDKNYNTNNAQLIFATHDTNLLDNKFFRRDQIWFTEKNMFGETALYSLVGFKIRNDASFEKDYIAGKYGAIPFIGDFTRMEVDEDAQKTI